VANKTIYKILVIRKSCLTGKNIFLYYRRYPNGKLASKAYSAARSAYRRACIRELDRAKNFDEKMKRQKETVQKVIDDLATGNPGTLTKQQKAAIRQLKKLLNETATSQSEFYDHIIEERIRRQL